MTIAEIFNLQKEIEDLESEIEDLNSEIEDLESEIDIKGTLVICKKNQLEALLFGNNTRPMLDKLYKICDIDFVDDDTIKELEPYLQYSETCGYVEEVRGLYYALDAVKEFNETKRILDKIEMYLRFLRQVSFEGKLTLIERQKKE